MQDPGIHWGEIKTWAFLSQRHRASWVPATTLGRSELFACRTPSPRHRYPTSTCTCPCSGFGRRTRVRAWVTTSAGRACPGSCPRPRRPRWLTHRCRVSRLPIWTETQSPLHFQFWKHHVQGQGWLCSLYPCLPPIDVINLLPTQGRLSSLPLRDFSFGLSGTFSCFIFFWLSVFFSVKFWNKFYRNNCCNLGTLRTLKILCNHHQFVVSELFDFSTPSPNKFCIQVPVHPSSCLKKTLILFFLHFFLYSGCLQSMTIS